MAGFYSKGLEQGLSAVTGVGAAPTGTLKMAFMSTGYVQNKETHQFWSDVSASIASGTTVQAVSGNTVTVDTVNNRVEIHTDDTTETPVTALTDKVVLFMDTGTPSTSPLIVCANLASTAGPVGGDLTHKVNAEGWGAVNY